MTLRSVSTRLSISASSRASSAAYLQLEQIYCCFPIEWTHWDPPTHLDCKFEVTFESLANLHMLDSCLNDHGKVFHA